MTIGSGALKATRRAAGGDRAAGLVELFPGETRERSSAAEGAGVGPSYDVLSTRRHALLQLVDVDVEACWVIGGSRRQARAAAGCVAAGWTLTVTAHAVRSLRAWCAAAGHPPDRCVCWRRGEDWYEPCAVGTPGAITAWRVDRRRADGGRVLLELARSARRRAR